MNVTFFQCAFFLTRIFAIYRTNKENIFKYVIWAYGRRINEFFIKPWEKRLKRRAK